jgi:hypothetical protein
MKFDQIKEIPENTTVIVNGVPRYEDKDPLPSCTFTFLHEDLQSTGPLRYDIGRVEEWHHPDDESGVGYVTAGEMYAYMKKNNMLEYQLGLRDLMGIQNKGVSFFKKYFGDKTVLAWKSIYLEIFNFHSQPFVRHQSDSIWAKERNRHTENIYVPSLSVSCDLFFLYHWEALLAPYNIEKCEIGKDVGATLPYTHSSLRFC